MVNFIGPKSCFDCNGKLKKLDGQASIFRYYECEDCGETWGVSATSYHPFASQESGKQREDIDFVFKKGKWHAKKKSA